MLNATHSSCVALIAAFAAALCGAGVVFGQPKMPGWEGHVQTSYSVHKHALKAPPEVETSVAKLAAYLAHPSATAKHDINKVRSIYRIRGEVPERPRGPGRTPQVRRGPREDPGLPRQAWLSRLREAELGPQNPIAYS
jgi:hypothetical protein